MITVITGTNRKNSKSKQIANFVYGLLVEKSNEEVRFLALEDLPTDFVDPDMYDENNQHADIRRLQEDYMIPATKFVFVVPEYNGGIPGILKFFLDACSIHKYSETFHGNKKAALIGISSGRSGTLRGMDYMTGFLNYLKIHVLPNKLPISSIDDIMPSDELTHTKTVELLDQFTDQFLAF